jgi:hypothetical protein
MKDIKSLPHLSIIKRLIIIRIYHVRQQSLGKNWNVRNYIQRQGYSCTNLEYKKDIYRD